MLANHLAYPLTVRLQSDKTHPKSSKTESYQYKTLPKLKTSMQAHGMQPHERLPGVSQLLTPVSPLSYGRSQTYRHQGHNSLDFEKRPAQHRSSLPLEEILCSPEQSSTRSSRSYTSPPLMTIGSQYNASPFVNPAAQYSIPLRRISPPTANPALANSASYVSISSPRHEPILTRRLSDLYHDQPPKHSSRSSVETCQTSISSGSIPPPTQARLIGERHFPGEGTCWVYDDGSHIRKEIDGEAVNPQWGVTKAGKPRKRLAQACLTCREKKIKCDLADPRCIQCDKSGRECRYATA